ncbi:hypothetical protein [Leifsonia naganoensis]|uniref:Uncharacterized protein n=1 Tax=Leifsonia naganoensis TaxID=150025 RepID=A0A853DMY0_9MICO|nr:hypothetical protein [Leifsonia naganoensis]NYK09647.1 hypothetical protein [Leifsonia naganoensis]
MATRIRAAGASQPHASYDAAGNTVAVGSDTQSSIYDAGGTLLLQTDPTGGTMLFLGDDIGFSGNISGSAVRGGGGLVSGGMQNDYSGSSEMIYSGGTAVGLGLGASANFLWSW